MGSDNGNSAKPTRLVPLAVLRLATDLRYELAVADRRVEAVRSRIVSDTSLNRNQIKDADLIYPGQTFAIDRGASNAEINAAVRHAKTRGAWSVGTVEDSDLSYLNQ